MAELSPEESARRRAYKTEWQRAQRAARKAEARCQDCGVPCAAPGPASAPGLKGFCAACSAKVRARDAARRAVERARKEAVRRRAQSRRGAPVCPHCGGRDLTRGGLSALGKKRFRCRACERWSYGKLPRKKPNRYPCPYCKGRCRRAGRSEAGLRRYLCTACRRKNTQLWPAPYASPGGPFPHRLTLYLGPAAHRRLIAYAEAHGGLRVALAVREIFRGYAHPLRGVTMARTAYDAWGEPVTVLRRPATPNTEPLQYGAATLPDLRAESMRARMAEKTRLGLLSHPRPVWVVARVSLALDDEAWEGLNQVMRSRGVNHQDAGRWMIENARG